MAKKAPPRPTADKPVRRSPGGWIMVRKILPRHIKILRAAGACIKRPRSRREVLAILIEFWIWADDMTFDGNLPGIYLSTLISEIPDTDLEFWEAVCGIGWLAVTPTGLRIPEFPSWLGFQARAKAEDAARKQAERKGACPEFVQKKPDTVGGVSSGQNPDMDAPTTSSRRRTKTGPEEEREREVERDLQGLSPEGKDTLGRRETPGDSSGENFLSTPHTQGEWGETELPCKEGKIDLSAALADDQAKHPELSVAAALVGLREYLLAHPEKLRDRAGTVRYWRHTWLISKHTRDIYPAKRKKLPGGPPSTPPARRESATEKLKRIAREKTRNQEKEGGK